MIQKLAISGINTFIAYLLIIVTGVAKLQLNSYFSPVYVVFIGSGLLVQLLMGTYTTMTSCLLHCLLADVDTCKKKGYDILQGKDRPKSIKRLVKLFLK